ncbi:MAG: hypothetical protein QXO22_08080 [Thermosphaera sp.]
MMVRIASVSNGLHVIIGHDDYVVDKVILNDDKELTDKVLGEHIIYVNAIYVEVMKNKILIYAPE